ncbi:MAG: Gfo/Idh/MocA family oxidoreductase [Planctomycetaceae bacterium]|nr:Gfo/Idh/MocA family oxidoreductase [Planctomycetaceae bacterium]
MKIRSILFFVLFSSSVFFNSVRAADGPFRLGIIGATTSHVSAFAGLINAPDGQGLYAKYRVVGVYVGGMPDNDGSWDRIPNVVKWLEENNIPFYDTIEEMLENVDGILLESIDGRPHLEQARPVIAAGKPLFIDKPMAGSLADVIEIFRLAEEKQVPVFSASSLRYVSGYQKMRNEEPQGKIFGAESTSPCSFNEKHPDLFWYGIHGVEALFTVMGPGCKTVSRTKAESGELAVGVWDGGRVGTFRGIHQGKADYGVKVFCEKGIVEAGTYEGYKPLVDVILEFFETGKTPIDPQETIEIFAFMEASDESVRQNGAAVSLEETIRKAKAIQFTYKTVELKANGDILLDGNPVSKSQLKGKFTPSDDETKQIKMILKAEKGVSLEAVREITALCDGKTVHLANYLY